MNKNNKTLFILSIFFLFVMGIVFSYSQFNRSYTESKNIENNKIRQDINIKKNEWNTLKDENYKIDEEFNQHYRNFYQKYGYEFGATKKDEFTKIISALKVENDGYLKEMKNLITNYSNYYSGEIYDSEELDGILGNFTQLTNFSNAEKFTNIPGELKIFELISKADGTISYLRSLNSESKKFDMLLFYTTLYSRNLNLMSKSEKIPPFELYRDIRNLKSIYLYLEQQSFNLGNLKAENLQYLENNFKQLMEKYYKNLGIMDSLNKGVENEK